MGDKEQGFRFEQVESPVVRSLCQFDTVRKSLYSRLSTIASEKPEYVTCRADVHEQVTDAAVAFARLGESLHSAYGYEEASDQIITLLVQDASERLEIFSGLIDGDDLYQIDQQDAEEMIGDIYRSVDDVDGLYETLYDTYHALLSGDTRMLIDCIEEQ